MINQRNFIGIESMAGQLFGDPVDSLRIYIRVCTCVRVCVCVYVCVCGRFQLTVKNVIELISGMHGRVGPPAIPEFNHAIPFPTPILHPHPLARPSFYSGGDNDLSNVPGNCL